MISSKFCFCTPLAIVLLVGTTFVHGRLHARFVKRQVPDYTNPNYGYPDPTQYGYPNPNPNNQANTGNRLYPVLDYDSLVRPYVNPNPVRVPNVTPFPPFPSGNTSLDPKFNSHPSNPFPNNPFPNNRYPNNPYPNNPFPNNPFPNNPFPNNPFPNNRYPNNPYPNKGQNSTYNPNFNWSNPNQNKNQNFSNGWNGNRPNSHNVQPLKPFPHNNFNEQHNNNNYNRPLNVPVPKTTCGKTLCSYVPSYPTKEIGQAVDRAREALRSGASSTSLQRKGLTLNHFNSKTHSSYPVDRTSTSYGINSCKTKSDTIYPHEGYSSDDGVTYYIVNIPNLSQGLPNVECDGGAGQTCGQGRPVSMSDVTTCEQTYQKVPLLALPYGGRNFNIDDFQLRMFDVPAGCSCMRRGY